MNRRPFATTCALALGLVVLAGCGSSSDDDSTRTSASSTAAAAPSTPATTTTAAKAVNAAFVATTFSSYVQSQQDGMEEVLKPNGGSIKLFNGNFDPTKVNSACQDAVSSGRYNVIFLQVLDPPVGVPCVKSAKAAGIPVVAMSNAIGTDPNDLQPQIDGVVGGVYLTPEGNAKGSVEQVTAACEGVTPPCKVIVEIGTPTDPLSNQAADAVAKLPGVKVVQKFASNYDSGVVAKTLPDILTAHPDANVYMSLSDESGLAGLPAIKAAGLSGKIKVLGSGGTPSGAKAVKSGAFFSSSGQWPVQEGEAAGKMAQQAVDGVPVEPNAIEAFAIDSPAILNKETVDEFKPEWGE